MTRFNDRSPEVQRAMCTPMHQILPPSPLPSSPGATTGALYLGSMAAVYDEDLLHEHHVTHLIQVLKVPCLPCFDKDVFECYRIGILDKSTVDLKPHLEAACNYIDKALGSGKNVLVHCRQSVSRSPAVVIAYLIRNLGMSYDSAHALLIGKRACINPNSGFVAVLQEWEGLCQQPAVGERFTT